MLTCALILKSSTYGWLPMYNIKTKQHHAHPHLHHLRIQHMDGSFEEYPLPQVHPESLGVAEMMLEILDLEFIPMRE